MDFKELEKSRRVTFSSKLHQACGIGLAQENYNIYTIVQVFRKYIAKTCKVPMTFSHRHSSRYLSTPGYHP